MCMRKPCRYHSQGRKVRKACIKTVVKLPARAEVMDRAAVQGAHVGEVPTCRGRARVPSGRGVAYVYSSTRVVHAVVYGYYACTVAHVWSVQ